MHFQPIHPNNSTIRSILETATHRPPTKSIQFRIPLLSSFDCMHPMFPVPHLFTSTLPNQHLSTRVMASVYSSSIFRLIQPTHVNHHAPQLHSSSVHSYRQLVSLFTFILSEKSSASEKDPTELSHFISIPYTPSMQNRINAKQNPLAPSHSHHPYYRVPSLLAITSVQNSNNFKECIESAKNNHPLQSLIATLPSFMAYSQEKSSDQFHHHHSSHLTLSIPFFSTLV